MIGKRYELEQEIGAGGMGTVYRAKDVQTGQLVAIKQLRPDMTNADLLERFQREGEALRELNHPNIVKMLDMVVEDDSHYLIMEYIGGGDLNEVLSTRQPIETILKLALDLADALTRAHKLNIVHRDLKPANVLIAEDGTVRLTDFGVAQIRQKERMTEAGTAVGTLDYLPPEALNGEEVDSRADIWSFGVMLFEMLTGKRPFTETSAGQTVLSIITNPPPDLEALRPDTPIALVDLVYRMLEKDRQARISSVRRVGTVLEEILQEGDSKPHITQRFVAVQPALTQTKHNLPLQTSPFIGRTEELASLAQLLHEPNTRLISIIAQGGMGKTRLALETARQALELFSSGVYWVELAPLASPDAIPEAIATALKYQVMSDGRAVKQQLFDYLHGKRCLLVLDNFEHLITGANLVTEFLQYVPNLKILTTSRQRLNQSSENLFELQPLDFPAWETPENAMTYTAARLFIQSARRIRPEFELISEDIPYIARICRLVQGVPLGIVLAATWLRLLSPQEIAEEMQNSFDFLETDMGDIPERQRSMRAVFDYSWQLLQAAEQTTLASLAVFRGGFTREAGQTITGANLRVLMSLVNQSLLQRNPQTGRYTIHELLRQYAYEMLDNPQAAQAQHAAYFANYVQERDKSLKGQKQLKTLPELDAEFENIRAAWSFAIEQGQAPLIKQMLETLYWYCIFRNRQSEGLALFQKARQVWSDKSALAGSLLARFPDKEDSSSYHRALQLAEQYPNQHEIAFAQHRLAKQLSHKENKFEEGLAYFAKCLEIFTQLGDLFYCAHVYDDRAWVYYLTQNIQKHEPDVLRGLELRQQIGDKIGEANSLRQYAAYCFYVKGAYHGIKYIEAAYAIAQETSDKESLMWLGIMRAFSDVLLWNIPQARLALVEPEHLALDFHNPVILDGIALTRAIIDAIQTENYASALETIKQHYPKGSNDGFRQGAGNILAMIAYIGLEDWEGLRRYLREDEMLLSIVQNQSDYGIWVVAALALFESKQGDGLFAAELFGLVYRYEIIQQGFYTHWTVVKAFLVELQQKLGVANYERAYQKGQAANIQDYIPRILEKISN